MVRMKVIASSLLMTTAIVLLVLLGVLRTGANRDAAIAIRPALVAGRDALDRAIGAADEAIDKRPSLREALSQRASVAIDHQSDVESKIRLASDGLSPARATLEELSRRQLPVDIGNPIALAASRAL